MKKPKWKTYYTKENIIINIVKLLNKENDQKKILQYFTIHLPTLIKEAKALSIKNGSILTLMVLWAKCNYTLKKYSEALDLLEQAEKLLESFDKDKL